MIEKGIDPNCKNSFGETPLLISARLSKNLEQIFRTLTCFGANNYATDKYTDNILSIACSEYDNIQNIKILLKYGFNVN